MNDIGGIYKLEYLGSKTYLLETNQKAMSLEYC